MQSTDQQELEKVQSQRNWQRSLVLIYVDTGAMYRAMAYYFLTNGIASSDETKIAEACPNVDVNHCL